MLSRLVITFLPRSKRFFISWLQSPSAVILEPPKMSDTVSTVSHEVTGPDAIVLVFWMNDKRREHIKNQRNYFINKNLSSQSYGFSSGHVWMWELDRLTKDWAPKNWCFWIVVLEKTLESSLDSKEIKWVNPKENEFWIFIGRTNDEDEAPVFCSFTWCEESTH